MHRLEDAEMSMVQGSEFEFPEAFDDCQNRRIKRAGIENQRHERGSARSSAVRLAVSR